MDVFWHRDMNVFISYAHLQSSATCLLVTSLLVLLFPSPWLVPISHCSWIAIDAYLRCLAFHDVPCTRRTFILMSRGTSQWGYSLALLGSMADLPVNYPCPCPFSLQCGILHESVGSGWGRSSEGAGTDIVGSEPLACFVYMAFWTGSTNWINSYMSIQFNNRMLPCMSNFVFCRSDSAHYMRRHSHLVSCGQTFRA
jgi:hypothetical protein